MRKFLISSAIWWLVFLPVMFASFLIVAVMLFTEWDGKTTWFGNKKYGRGETHYKFPTGDSKLRQWWFLCIRNPVSNFGKQTLSVSAKSDWAWLEDKQIYGKFHWMYGWKNPVAGRRTFVYRPWFHK